MQANLYSTYQNHVTPKLRVTNKSCCLLGLSALPDSKPEILVLLQLLGFPLAALDGVDGVESRLAHHILHQAAKHKHRCTQQW